MTKTTLLGLGAGALLSLAAFGAQALPASPDLGGASPLVTTVAEGCGPGFFRGARGFCRPMRGFGRPRSYRRPFAGPRRFYGPRRFHRY